MTGSQKKKNTAFPFCGMQNSKMAQRFPFPNI